MLYRFKSGSPEWLKFRQSFIMATEVASLFGVNPYTSMAAILREKMGDPINVDSHHLRDGKIYEPAVLQALREDLGWDVGYLQLDGLNSFIFNQIGSYVAATPDAWRWDVPAVLELKTTTEGNLTNNWLAGKPPTWYLSQVQAQLSAISAEKGFLVAKEIKKDPRLVVYEVNRSEAFIDRMESLASEAVSLLRQGSDKFRATSKDRVFAEEELHKSCKFVSVSSYKVLEHHLPSSESPPRPEDTFDWGTFGL